MTKIEEVSLINKSHSLRYDNTVICFNDKCLDDMYVFKKGVVYEFFRKINKSEDEKVEEYKKGIVYEIVYELLKPTIESEDENIHYYFREYGNDRLYEIDSRQHSILTNDFYNNTEMRNLSNNEYIQKKFYLTRDRLALSRFRSTFGVKWNFERIYIISVKKGLIDDKTCLYLNREIKAKVIAPLAFLGYMNKEVLHQFSESINYTLEHLESMCKLADVVDLQKEIDLAHELFMGYCDFAKSADETLRLKQKKEINEFLNKHHSLMNSLSDGIKLLTKKDQ
ncbi:hypothetical protein P8815_18110 [Bacillus altitudinis]|uniref:hypothetical protein n=1 Tax=Bacillus TaxID=1386 RepID=UPI000260A9BF|nr:MULTISPECIES: hypothetical protein [Bacillus]EIL83372.1 hypothetical protein BAME_34360 [Bacillus sp. M 2-6]MEC0473655.1 hypothetical protein [Bacillus altitudinis]